MHDKGITDNYYKLTNGANYLKYSIQYFINIYVCDIEQCFKFKYILDLIWNMNN